VKVIVDCCTEAFWVKVMAGCRLGENDGGLQVEGGDGLQVGEVGWLQHAAAPAAAVSALWSSWQLLCGHIVKSRRRFQKRAEGGSKSGQKALPKAGAGCGDVQTH
jgi:hypothetical protein